MTVLTCAACAPVAWSARLRSAESAHRAAASAEAERRAPYEFVLASLYLEKAREESSEANYARALELLHRAEQSARRARLLAERRSVAASTRTDR